MGIKVLHVNIRNWKSNNYLLKFSLSDSNPDIILLNELSLDNNVVPKIKGYKVCFKCIERYSGVAILVKHIHKHTFLEFTNNNILAIKLYTNLGPLYIVTSYTPPRYNSIPTIEINHILNKNIPTLIISDFNARHPTFHNSNITNTNHFGRQLHNLCNSRNLDYLGPDFNTFRNNINVGKPDLVIANNQFRIFHNRISEGRGVGSDHLPIIMEISMVPIRIICNPRIIIDKIDARKFKEELEKRFFGIIGRQGLYRN